MKTIKVYTSPTCQPCRAVKRWLDKRGIGYEEVDATVNVDDANAIRALGYSAAPVVIVNDGAGDVHFGGFNPDLLAKHCEEAA